MRAIDPKLQIFLILLVVTDPDLQMLLLIATDPDLQILPLKATDLDHQILVILLRVLDKDTLEILITSMVLTSTTINLLQVLDPDLEIFGLIESYLINKRYNFTLIINEY